MIACRNKSRDMGHIDHEIRTDLIGNLTHSLEVDGTAVRARPRDDHLRMALLRDALHLVVINKAVLIDAVGNLMEIIAGDICR